MTLDSNTIKSLELLSVKMGYRFKDSNLLLAAITHKSFIKEMSFHKATSNTTSHEHNERLEFLGDAVLDLLISDLLVRRFPAEEEGPLTLRRSTLVNEISLSALALELGLDQLIRMGKGERSTGGDKKPRLLACCLEAIFGSIYLDGGFAASLTLAASLFHDRIERLQSEDDYRTDFKTRLQEHLQKKGLGTPTYVTTSEEGPSHLKVFAVSVQMDNITLGTGTGKTKKQAEQEAAKKALEDKSYEKF